MLDGTDLVNLIKKAAVEAVTASQPSGVYFGRVSGTSPLKIFIEQKLILGDKQLVVTQTAQNLSAGDEVVLLRMQGGQKFVVIDKVVKA